MAFWNSVDLTQPAVNTCRINISLNDINTLTQTLADISSTLNDMKQFHVEAAMLSRTKYKMKNAYHGHVGFQKLTKVNRCLLHYLAVDFPSVYSRFADLLPKPDELPGQSGNLETYMPTKQSLEWVLVRTQGFARLFCVVADTCQQASHFWLNQISMGHLLNISVLVMGILARIWAYAKYLVVNACEWYDKLKPYLEILLTHGMAWKPADYVFPDDLKLWLNMPHITNVKPSKPQEAGSDSVVQKALALLGSNDNEDKTQALDNLGAHFASRQEVDIDMGEAVSRDEVEKLRSGKISKKNKKRKKLKNSITQNKSKTKATKKKEVSRDSKMDSHLAVERKKKTNIKKGVVAEQINGIKKKSKARKKKRETAGAI